MGASAWIVFDRAKKKMGQGSFDLLTGVYRMSLHTSAASTNISASTTTTWASIGSEVTGGGYARKTLATPTWTAGTSSGVMKYDFVDPIFTASLSAITSVRYAVVMLSTSAGGGLPLCYAALSTASFTVSGTNTLTVQLATTGVFTLA